MMKFSPHRVIEDFQGRDYRSRKKVLPTVNDDFFIAIIIKSKNLVQF